MNNLRFSQYSDWERSLVLRIRGVMMHAMVYVIPKDYDVVLSYLKRYCEKAWIDETK